MTKYHIKKDGTPGVCTAINRCPYGGEGEHYPTKEAAHDAFQKQMEIKHGLGANKIQFIKNFIDNLPDDVNQWGRFF